VVAAVGTTTCDLALPADQPTCVQASLQMNVPAGIYMLETVVWDRKADRVLAKGPAAAVVIQEGPAFSGYIQLNARMAAPCVDLPEPDGRCYVATHEARLAQD
jgi:hypothetical protein